MMIFKEQRLQFGTFAPLECDSLVNDGDGMEEI